MGLRSGSHLLPVGLRAELLNDPLVDAPPGGLGELGVVNVSLAEE